MIFWGNFKYPGGQKLVILILDFFLFPYKVDNYPQNITNFCFPIFFLEKRRVFFFNHGECVGTGHL